MTPVYTKINLPTHYEKEPDLEIPGATYNGPTNNPEVIRLPQPTGQTYTARVVAIETLGSEPFSVTLSHNPPTPATLAITPSSIEGNLYIDEIPQPPIVTSLKEMSGQHEVTDITMSSTDLLGPNGSTIGSEDVIFDLPSTTIQAGNSIDCSINLNVAPDLLEGEYTGDITIDSSANSIVIPIKVNLMLLDFDGDGFTIGFDNCPCHYNPGQIDSDEDGIGDACEDKRGDLNYNETIEVGDIQSIINIILGVSPQPTLCELWAGDCDNNKTINVCDVQIAINKFLAQ